LHQAQRNGNIRIDVKVLPHIANDFTQIRAPAEASYDRARSVDV